MSNKTDEQKELAMWLAMTDEEKAQWYWDHPESIPDSEGG